MAKLESLVVDLHANAAELRKGLDEARGHLKGFGDHVKEVGEKLEALAVFEVGKELIEGLAEFAIKGAEAADRMGKLALAAQVPVAEFSRLNYAAKLGGLATEDLGTALNKLNKAMGEAGAGGVKQAAIFRGLGVSLKDASGNLRGTNEVFTELSRRFQELAPGAAKATLENDLFGKSGAKLEATFRGVAEGLAAAGGEADRFGLTISEKTFEASEKFVDNLERMKMVVTGVGTQVAGQLAPALAQLTKELLSSKDGAQGLKDAVTVIATALKLLTTGAIGVAAAFNYVAISLSGGLAAAVAAFTGHTRDANATVKDMQAELSKVTDQLESRFKAVWSPAAEEVKKPGEEAKKTADNILKVANAAEKVTAESKTAFDTLQHVLDDYGKKMAELASGGKDPIAEMQFRLEKGDLARSLGKIGDQAEVMRLRIMAAARALELLKYNAAAAKLAFSIEMGGRATNRAMTKQRDEFDNIGSTQEQTSQQNTQGFTDFDDALEKLAQATKKHAALLGAAQIEEQMGHTTAAQNLLRAADYTDVAAQQAQKAADEFKKIKTIQVSEIQKSIDKIAAGLAGAANHMLSKLGELGSVVSSAIQGFQQGGWWGAIIAVIIEVFSRFKRFGEIQQAATDQLYALVEQLGPALDKLTDGFEKLQGSLGSMLQTVGTALSPVIAEVGRILGIVGRVLGPIFAMIENIIGPLTGMLDAFMGIANALDPLNPILKLVGALFKAVGAVMLEIEGAIMQFVGTVMEGIRVLLADIGLDSLALEVSKVSTKLLSGAADAQHKAEGMFADLGDEFSHFFDDTGKDKAGTSINTAASDAGAKVAGLGDASAKTAASMGKLNAALTNAPSGFRYNAAVFNATSVGKFGPGGQSSKGDMHFHINGVVAITVDQLAAAVVQRMNKKNWHQTGQPPPY